jgi:hypothetical protein
MIGGQVLSGAGAGAQCRFALGNVAGQQKAADEAQQNPMMANNKLSLVIRLGNS